MYFRGIIVAQLAEKGASGPALLGMAGIVVAAAIGAAVYVAIKRRRR